MRTILRVDHVEPKLKDGERYWKTYATLDDGTEAEGFGKEFDVGDKVEVFFDDRWNVIKMQKG